MTREGSDYPELPGSALRAARRRRRRRRSTRAAATRALLSDERRARLDGGGARRAATRLTVDRPRPREASARPCRVPATRRAARPPSPDDCALALAAAAGRRVARRASPRRSGGSPTRRRRLRRGRVARRRRCAPDGALELGPRASVDADRQPRRRSGRWRVLARRSVALAGDRGRIDRWTASGGVRAVGAAAGAGQVLCLARDGDGLLAGTGPDGLVYRIAARGDTSLVRAPANATCGRWRPAGRARGTRRPARAAGCCASRAASARTVARHRREQSGVARSPTARGGAYAGGDSKGRVVHVRAGGAPRTVFDAGEDEVRALALRRRRRAVRRRRSRVPAVDAATAKTTDDARAPAARQPRRRARATVYRIVPDSAGVAVVGRRRSRSSSRWPLRSRRLRGRPGSAATGNRAGVYRARARHGARSGSRRRRAQVTALATGADGALYAATSNPARAVAAGPGAADRGELLSARARRPALRALRPAARGTATRAAGASAGDAQRQHRCAGHDVVARGARRRREDGGACPRRPARYLQWKVTLAGGTPAGRIGRDRVARAEPAAADRRRRGRAAGRGVPRRRATPRSEPVTQTLPGGQKVEYSCSRAAAPRRCASCRCGRAGCARCSGRRSDPNGDPLRSAVELRREGGGPWTEIGKDLEASTFTLGHERAARRPLSRCG